MSYNTCVSIQYKKEKSLRCSHEFEILVCVCVVGSRAGLLSFSDATSPSDRLFAELQESKIPATILFLPQCFHYISIHTHNIRISSCFHASSPALFLSQQPACYESAQPWPYRGLLKMSQLPRGVNSYRTSGGGIISSLVSGVLYSLHG